MMPLVTCLVSVFNGQCTILRCISSLTAQDYENLEIIVIDDGSTDRTAEILDSIRDNRLKIVRQRNFGLYYSLAKGALLANGKYIMRLDADDEALPGRIVAQVDFLESNPDVAMVGGSELRVDKVRRETYLREYPVDDFVIRRISAKCIPYAHSAWMYRRKLVEEGLNYDPSYDFMGDFDYFIRIAQTHRVANIAKPVVRRYISSASFFHRRYSNIRQNIRLASLSLLAVRRFGLPLWYYVFPFLRLIYPYIPDELKRHVRLSQGLKESNE